MLKAECVFAVAVARNDCSTLSQGQHHQGRCCCCCRRRRQHRYHHYGQRCHGHGDYHSRYQYTHTHSLSLILRIWLYICAHTYRHTCTYPYHISHVRCEYTCTRWQPPPPPGPVLIAHLFFCRFHRTAKGRKTSFRQQLLECPAHRVIVFI